MPEAFEAIDRIKENDEEFAEGLGNGYLLYYDRKPPRPELTCTDLYTFMQDCVPEKSERWRAGCIAGWFIGFGENNPDYFWESDDPPPHTHV